MRMDEFRGGWQSIGDRSLSRVNNGGFEWVGTIRMGTRLESACGDESKGACGWDGRGGVRMGEWKSSDAAGMR